MKRLVAVLVAFVGGCAVTSPAPGGPLRAGSFTQLQPTWAIAYGPASARIDGVEVSGTAQREIATFPNPVPLTIGFRQALGSHFEASVDVGWVDSGIGLRVGLPSVADTPLVLAAGLRSCWISVFANGTRAGSLSLEAYPDLSRAKDGSVRLILSMGVSAGNFWHEVGLPESYRTSSDAPSSGPSVEVVRPETRLQTAIGLYLQQRGRRSTIIALSPWFLLSRGDPTSEICDSCDSPHVVSDFSQTWGVALLLAPSF